MSIRAICYRTISNFVFNLKGFQYPQTLRFLKISQWWSKEQIQRFQNDSLCSLVEYVYKYVPYYSRIMREQGLKPDDIRTTGDLIKIPILSKEIFKKNREELFSTKINNFKTDIRRTGGSTGEPLQVLIDYSNSAWEGAAYTRGLGFAEYQKGEKIIMLFGGSLGLGPMNRLDKLKAKISGDVFLPAFEISIDTLKDFVKTIIKSKAQFLCGYTSAIYLLAKLMDDANLSIPLKAVFPTAENLYDFQKELIEKVFKCRVFNQYGCGELNSIAFECHSHSGLHITDEMVFVESLNGTERVQNGQMGALTLTTLHNYAMPLIRYQNGDIISIQKDTCSCGRGLGRIDKIFGRSNDLLLSKDGRLISGAFIPHLFRTTDGIKEVQVIQETKDSMILNIVKGDMFSQEELQSRISVINKYLGDINIKVQYVSSIPRTPKGKLKSVISKFGDCLLHK